MRCPKCGVLNDDTSAYCYACGKELTHSTDELTSDNVKQSSSDIEPVSGPQVASNEAEANKPQNNISDTHNSDTDASQVKAKPNGFRIGLALIVCFVIVVVYNTIGVLAFNWKNGGGIIPQLILWTIVVYVWKVITSAGNAKGE